MVISPPELESKLSPPTLLNNFMPLQSATLTVGTGSISVTFTNLPNNQRLTYKISNTGNRMARFMGGNSASGPVIATVPSSTPKPTSGESAVSNCDTIPIGAILIQDYIAGTNTIAAITSSSTTTLEISIGTGQ